MNTDFMKSGAIMNFIINLSIGTISIAIVGCLTMVFGEALKYILGIAGLACLLYVIFYGNYSGNGAERFLGHDE